MNEDFIIKTLALPPLASAHGGQIDSIIWLIHLLMILLFIGWGIFFVCVLYRFRKSKNPKAHYHGVKNHISSYLETSVAIAEIILLAGFSIPFWAKVVNALPDEKKATVVHIVAEQFAWNIHYPGPDGVFGRTDPKLINNQRNPIGLDQTDVASHDDIVTLNQLHLPVDKPAIIYLTSKDVIHCFSLAIMRVKQDIIPGMKMPTWFIPVKTGKSEIGCAQLCGLGHYHMRGFLTVDTQKEFEEWLKSQEAAPSLTPSGGDDFWN